MRRYPVVVFTLAVGLLWAPMAKGQVCFEHALDIEYSLSNCEGDPLHDRVYRQQVVQWKGHEYLFVNKGNEIQIFDIDTPLAPQWHAESHFAIPPFGDVDYNLKNFTVCDDCRYGVANFNTSSVLFDLGTDATPRFDAFHVNTTASVVVGSFTFTHGGQQYLVAAQLGTTPCVFGFSHYSGLYVFDDIDDANLTLLHCIDNAGAGTRILNGLKVEGGAGGLPVIYLGDQFSPSLRMYQFQENPTPELVHLDNLAPVRMFNSMGAAVDTSVGLLTIVCDGELRIFDIGWASGAPDNPVLLSTTQVDDVADAIALHYPVIWVTDQLAIGFIQTFDVTSPDNPVLLDDGFWDANQPWNSISACLRDTNASFSSNGEALYISRWNALQVIDSSSCTTIPEPDAGVLGPDSGATLPDGGGPSPDAAASGDATSEPPGDSGPRACSGCRASDPDNTPGRGALAALFVVLLLALRRRYRDQAPHDSDGCQGRR